MIWTALQKYSTMFIQFISGIILARLLTPYDYGCIGMLGIFMVLAETFIDGGFGSALIQKKHPTEEDYSTIFWWNIFMAFILYLILYLSAPAIARFYDIPLLSSVLRVQGIILFIYAFNVVQSNQLRKKLNFRLLSIVTITTSITSLVITVFMAYKGYGVWALVVQNIIVALIPAIVFWFYVKWRPIQTFSWISFRQLFSFGAYMFLTQLTNQFSQQLRGLFIGKAYNPSMMGLYSKALGTEKLASHSISQILNQVTYPLYAEVQDDTVAMQNMIKRLSTCVAFLTFPLMLCLILTAKPLFIVLYSERWKDCVPFFQIICLGGIAGCLQSVNLQTISAIGKSRIMFCWALVKQGLGLFLIIGGLLIFGIYGLLWGAVLNSWICTLINMLLVSKYIGYKFLSQIRDLTTIILMSAVSFVISYYICFNLNISFYAQSFFALVFFLTIYLSWSVLFKPEPYVYIRDVVLSKIRK